jgi:hypothetical protein
MRLNRTRHLERFVIGLLFATMLVRIALIWNEWTFADVNAYLAAAHRLRDGQPLYAGFLDPDSYRVFRYAPWFAWLWVPLSYLPRDPLAWGWGALLAVASGAILVGLARLRRAAAWALAFLIAPWLFSLVQVGNIQPIIVAILAFGISRRSGPLWVGVAASLKVVPMLYALPYLARREWGRLAASVGVAAILLAPMLLTDLSGYTTDPGRSDSLYYYVSPTAWAVGAIVSTAVALALAWRHSPYVWVAVALALMLVPPRSHVTYATYLVIGLLGGAKDRIGAIATDA